MVGAWAGHESTEGDKTFVGQAAGRYNTTGVANTFVGRQAGMGHSTNKLTGGLNVGIGAYSLYYCTGGEKNVAIGYQALNENSTGNTNTAVGYRASRQSSTATGITALGYLAGEGLNTTDRLYIARNSDAAGNDGLWIHGDGVGACIQGNNSTTWDQTSDRRLKKNIVDSSKGLAEINQIRVANFQYRTEDEIDMAEFPLADGPHQVVLRKGDEKVYAGVIAQEVEAVLPECIKVSAEGAKTVSTDPILWSMLNAIKELSAKNEALEARLAALES